MRRTWAGAALAATAALTLSAWGWGGADPAAAAGPPRPGGTLRFAVSSDQGCADPPQVTSNGP